MGSLIMRRVIGTIGVLGCFLFSVVFALTFVAPSVIEKTAREFVIHQVEEEVTRHQAEGGKLEQVQEKLAWLKDKYADEIASAKRQLEGGLRVKIEDILNQICNMECLRRRGIEISDVTLEMTHERISALTDASAKLGEMIKGSYYSLISELLKDIRIFTGINALLFLLITVVLASKSSATKPLVVPTGLLFVATILSSVFYIFGQNWFYTIIFNEYVGYGYLSYVGIIFAFLADIVFNQGELTLSIIESVIDSLKDLVSCFTRVSV